MALTPKQIAARAGKLGGSDMGCIMRGDRPKIRRLWLEKRGLEPPDDLSDNVSVQIGIATEPVNREFFERRQRMTLSRVGDVVTHYAHDWACCTLDGWIDALQCPLECKHSSGREPYEVIEQRYQPQMQWQMEVTGADQICLSVFMGTTDLIVEFIKRNADYAKTMVEYGWQFIQHVRNGTEPVDMPAVPDPVDAKAIYDMTGNNLWAAQASIWLELRDSAAMHADAVKILKGLVPPDAKKCFGHEVQITRDRADRLSLREMPE